MTGFLGRRWLVVGLVAGVILVSSLAPMGGSGNPTLPAPDKLLHGVGYAVLAAVACWSRRDRSLDQYLAVVVAVTCFGGVVELLQFPLPTRRTSLADAAANAVGATLGTLCWIGYRRLATAGVR